VDFGGEASSWYLNAFFWEGPLLIDKPWETVSLDKILTLLLVSPGDVPPPHPEE